MGNVRKILLASVAAALLAAPVFAADDGLQALMDANTKPATSSKVRPVEQPVLLNEDDVRKALSVLDTVDWANAIPVTNMIMVKTEDGETLLATADGRILIKGGLVIDGWNRRQIRTKEDAERSWLAPLSSFGMTISELPVYYYGVDKKEYDAILMVDPLGGYPNEKLFEQVRNMGEKYRFAIVLTPVVHGRESGARGRALWCAQDQQASLEVLMSGDISTTPQELANCDVSKVMKAIGLAQFLQLKQMPHLIRSDGKHFQGAPKHLAQFLAPNRQSNDPSEE